MGGMNLREVLVSLDNIIVFWAALEELEDRLSRALQRLKELGLKLFPEKCSFFLTSVKYLGHAVSTNGVKTDPEKMAALMTWSRPNNIKELKSWICRILPEIYKGLLQNQKTCIRRYKHA